MASASTMHPPAPHGRSPPPPPPPGKGKPRRPPPPPPKAPSQKRPPPPPPPKAPPPKIPAKAPPTASKPTRVSIRAPTEMRDEREFHRMHQVGQGTYGSVFVAQDNVSKEIVAMKRINTEQEANGFPITALREVKILKALNHTNIVTLREIVTSKGE